MTESRQPPGADGAADLPSSGVEVLIDRLRQQGVEAGKAAEAEIVANAEREAERIVQEARAKAAALVAEAAEQAAQSTASGEDALRVAMRDTILRLRETLRERIEQQVRRLVAKPLVDEAFVRELIVAVVRRAREDTDVDGAEAVEILLPPEVIGVETLQQHPEQMDDRLGQFARDVAAATWREGITVGVLDQGGRGLRVRLTDQELELDLTDQAIAALLLKHLQPRFRVIMDGVVW